MKMLIINRVIGKRANYLDISSSVNLLHRENTTQIKASHLGAIEINNSKCTRLSKIAFMIEKNGVSKDVVFDAWSFDYVNDNFVSNCWSEAIIVLVQSTSFLSLLIRQHLQSGGTGFSSMST